MECVPFLTRLFYHSQQNPKSPDKTNKLFHDLKTSLIYLDFSQRRKDFAKGAKGK